MIILTPKKSNMLPCISSVSTPRDDLNSSTKIKFDGWETSVFLVGIGLDRHQFRDQLLVFTAFRGVLLWIHRRWFIGAFIGHLSRLEGLEDWKKSGFLTSLWQRVHYYGKQKLKQRIAYTIPVIIIHNLNNEVLFQIVIQMVPMFTNSGTALPIHRSWSHVDHLLLVAHSHPKSVGILKTSQWHCLHWSQVDDRDHLGC